MKKTLSMVFAAALAAAIFFGCSNSSSDNSALLLAMASSGSAPDRTGLPANVGNNDFAGKTFKRTSSETTEKYAFGTDTVTWSFSNPSYGNTNIVYAYTYNATTKQLFLKVASTNVRQDISTMIGHFTTDAGFINAIKNFFKQRGSSDTDEQLENTAKGMRYGTFSTYGYQDSTNATEVPDRIIAKYNAGQAETKTRNKLVEIKAFDLSGSTLKLSSDPRIPAGKGLNEIYGVYGVTLSITDDNSIPVYNLSYSSMPSVTPDIVKLSEKKGFRVSSITADKINTSATAEATGSVNLDWTFTPAAGSINYNTNKTTTSGVFTIPGLGKATVTYATADNVPSMTSADPWTQE